MLSPQHTAILRSVSRSFFLSLRFLPAPVRGPISLGYLLARASDTIADTAERPSAERMDLLDVFRKAASGEAAPDFFEDIRKFAASVNHAGERSLLERLDECLALLASSPPGEAVLIREVLGHILRGQRLDVERFLHPAALPDAPALEEYTFLVAGCVGEFWTKVCALRLPSCYRLPEEEMIRHGIRYGQALQLINILRDQPKDMATGRCYLPEIELRAAGLESLAWPSENWPAWHAVRHRWTSIAREHLHAARLYIRALDSLRLRFATLMPLLIGEATLDLLDAQLKDQPPSAVKISRREVRLKVGRALWLALRGQA